MREFEDKRGFRTLVCDFTRRSQKNAPTCPQIFIFLIFGV